MYGFELFIRLNEEFQTKYDEFYNDNHMAVALAFAIGVFIIFELFYLGILALLYNKGLQYITKQRKLIRILLFPLFFILGVIIIILT